MDTPKDRTVEIVREASKHLAKDGLIHRGDTVFSTTDEGTTTSFITLCGIYCGKLQVVSGHVTCLSCLAREM